MDAKALLKFAETPQEAVLYLVLGMVALKTAAWLMDKVLHALDSSWRSLVFPALVIQSATLVVGCIAFAYWDLDHWLLRFRAVTVGLVGAGFFIIMFLRHRNHGLALSCIGLQIGLMGWLHYQLSRADEAWSIRLFLTALFVSGMVSFLLYLVASVALVARQPDARNPQ